jgi:transposase
VRQRQATAQHLVFIDAAGPCGDWRSRDLTHTGQVGGVVAPSFMPHTAGDRVNTDRRDAVPLARLLRSGDLTPVDVPAGADAASRDLSRAREETLHELKTAKLRLHALLLRPDSRSTGRAPGGPAPLRWLSAVVGPTPAPPIVFHASVRAVTEPPERRQRLDQELQAPGTAWRLCPVLDARQALRGVQVTVAVTTGAERGDLPRVEHPRHLMTYVGLTPSASSRVSADTREASRRPGLPRPVGLWSQGPGPLATRQQ